jgi:hypothetical protein
MHGQLAADYTAFELPLNDLSAAGPVIGQR